MNKRDGKKKLNGVLFSDLRTTGMILKEIENELIPQTVVNSGKLSDKVQLGEWIPWNSSNEKNKKQIRKKLESINFLIERTIKKKILT
tara:strand:+ start:212 stop:475 length:264 start_codon:yes stop_codon:yes gene_type:complete